MLTPTYTKNLTDPCMMAGGQCLRPDVSGPNEPFNLDKEAYLRSLLDSYCGGNSSISSFSVKLLPAPLGLQGRTCGDLWRAFHGVISPVADFVGAARAAIDVQIGARIERCGTSSLFQPVYCVSPAVSVSRFNFTDGITIGHFIFCAEAHCQGFKPPSVLLQHELVHVDQYERYGDAFFLKYVQELPGGRRCGNALEAEAYIITKDDCG